MNKEEFLNRLREALKGLPAAETEKSALYYAEILDDRMEDGMSEVEAVASLGAPEEVAENLKLELPLGTLVRSKMSGSGMGAGTVVLLVLGSPVWLPLLLAGLAVALSLAVSLWAIVLSLWTVVLALILTLPLSVVGAAMKWANFPAEAVFLLGAACVSGGLAIPAFFFMRKATEWCGKMTMAGVKGIKRLLIGRKK
ncbi:MAG: DUF1700 domain-containing protein [Eubacteriales bacterium]|nr:DUF1700 domain-containing protein [Eubacteriales bacterium]